MRSSTSAGRGPTANLNITPLVDIALVLLVIFLITTPLMMRSVPVDIPARADGGWSPDRPVVLTLGPAGTVELRVEASVEDFHVTELRARLEALGADRLRSEPVFLGFHPEVPYGDAVALADTVRGFGVDRLNLVVADEPAPE